jgi:hypothetical protein
VTTNDPIILRFSGIEVEAVAPDRAEIEFHFGPHVARDSVHADRLRVEFTRSGSASGANPLPHSVPVAPAGAEFLVRRSDGTPLLRRAFRSWGDLPPALPPYAVLQDRFVLSQAVVLAKGGASVALIGGPYSEKVNIAATLARLSWEFVSGQLLVLDRATRQVMPYLVPLEVRGEAAAWLRGAGLPEGRWRCGRALSGGEVLLVRPECLGGTVPVQSRIPRPSLVRLCRTADDRVGLTPWDFVPHAWPAGSEDALAGMPTYRLEISRASGAEEAAGLIDRTLAPEKDTACLDVLAMPPAPRAGLTASLRI